MKRYVKVSATPQLSISTARASPDGSLTLFSGISGEFGCECADTSAKWASVELAGRLLLSEFVSHDEFLLHGLISKSIRATSAAASSRS